MLAIRREQVFGYDFAFLSVTVREGDYDEKRAGPGAACHRKVMNVV